MNLKEHLNKHKIDIDHKAPTSIWDQIDRKLQPSHRPISIRRKLYLAITAAAVVIAISLITVQYNHIQNTNQEITALKDTMTSLLTNKSVGQRIKAVTLSEQATNGNQEIAQVLLHTMTDDPSKNVRLAAIDALSQFVGNEEVRVAIIKHLGNAKEPYVQIKLINILSGIKEKNAVPTLDQIIEDKTKSILVKQKAKAGRQLIIQT